MTHKGRIVSCEVHNNPNGGIHLHGNSVDFISNSSVSNC